MRHPRNMIPLLVALLWAPAALTASDSHEAPAAGADAVTSADAVWVAHLDIEAMLDSKMGKAMLDALEDEPHASRLESFTEKTGMDPTEDMVSITLWGRSFTPGDGVAVVRGEINHKKLLKLLDDVKDHAQFKHGEHTIHQWTQKPEGKHDDGTRFGAFHGDELVVFSRHRKEIEHALDVLDGKADAQSDLAANKRVLPDPSEGVWLQAAAVDIRLPKHLPPQAAALKDMHAASMAMGETRGQVYLDITMSFDNKRTADQLRQMGQGLLAMGQMRLDRLDDEEAQLPHWAPLVRTAKIGGEDEMITFTVSIAAEDVIAMAEEAEARRHGKRGHHHGRHED